MVVFLDPIETGGWLSTSPLERRRRRRSPTAASSDSVPRASRTSSGSTGTTSRAGDTAEDDALVLAVANGIHSVDRIHLQTVELNYFDSGSLDDARWRPLIGIDCRVHVQADVRAGPARVRTQPDLRCCMVEASYESEQIKATISRGDPADPPAPGVLGDAQRRRRPVLRQPLHVAVHRRLAGDTSTRSGSTQLGYLIKLFAAGRGTGSCPTQAPVRDRRLRDVHGHRQRRVERLRGRGATADGTLGMAYLPSARR